MTGALGRPPAVVFLDRDGTVIRHIHHLTDPDQVELLPNAAQGIAYLKSMGLKVVVCTNQSVVGRGLCSAERVEEVNLRMLEHLAEHGVELDGILYCPHLPDEGCECRKPAPGLGVQAARLVGIDPDRAVVIGDDTSDVGFGRALGALTVLIDTPTGDQVGAPSHAAPDYAARDLVAAARWIESQLTVRG